LFAIGKANNTNKESLLHTNDENVETKVVGGATTITLGISSK